MKHARRTKRVDAPSDLPEQTCDITHCWCCDMPMCCCLRNEWGECGQSTRAVMQMIERGHPDPILVAVMENMRAIVAASPSPRRPLPRLTRAGSLFGGQQRSRMRTRSSWTTPSP